jgi:hypothetical protein
VETQTAFVIDVPCVPDSLNKTLRKHWHSRGKEKHIWMNAMYLFSFEERRQLTHWAAAKTKMRVTVTFYHSRLFDDDNAHGAAKVIFDALRESGFIHDDRREFLEQVVDQQKCPHRQRHTVIEIEPAEPVR